jgi:carbonic anhydrase/acetyltransferase-like protein (isoleucine patch superfamily)
VWFNSVLRADGERITVGADTNIQDLALCHVDPGRPLVIGERVTIGHGAILRGCTIEDDVIVGAGCVRACVRACVRVCVRACDARASARARAENHNRYFSVSRHAEPQ